MWLSIRGISIELLLGSWKISSLLWIHHFLRRNTDIYITQIVFMTRSPAPILCAVIEIVTPHQDTDHILLTPLNLTPTEKWIFSFRAFSIEFAFRIMENFISFMNTWFRAKKYQLLHYANRFYDALRRAFPRQFHVGCDWDHFSTRFRIIFRKRFHEYIMFSSKYKDLDLRNCFCHTRTPSRQFLSLLRRIVFRTIVF